MQDKELRQQHSQIQQLQERAGAPPPSTTNEIRRLREELEDLRHENTGVNRSLEYEKAETDRLTHEVAAEKLKTRQVWYWPRGHCSFCVCVWMCVCVYVRVCVCVCAYVRVCV